MTAVVPRPWSASSSLGLSEWLCEASCSLCRSRWWFQTPLQFHRSWRSASQWILRSRPPYGKRRSWSSPQLRWRKEIIKKRKEEKMRSVEYTTSLLETKIGTYTLSLCGYLHNSFTKGMNSWFWLRGRTEHLYGATVAGKLKNCWKKTHYVRYREPGCQQITDLNTKNNNSGQKEWVIQTQVQFQYI